MRKFLIFSFIFLSLIISAFAEEQRKREILPQDAQGNLELHVVTDEQVSLRVFIDDKIAVDEEFNKIKGPNLGIAPHQIFIFYVEPGDHVLSAETGMRKQIYQCKFSLNEGKKWIALYYEDIERTKGDRPFSMEIYDQEIRYQ